MGAPRKARLSDFIGWTLRDAARDPWLCLLGGVAILVQVATGMTLPIGLKFILDDVVPAEDLVMLRVTIAAMGGAVLLFLLSRLVQDWAISNLGARVLARLRRAVFERLQSQSNAFFKGYDESDILSRAGADIRELELATTSAVPGIVRQALKLLVNGAILFVIEWRLAAGVSVLLLPVLVAPRRLLERGHDAEADRQQATADALAVVQESMFARQVVRAFQLAGLRSQVFDDALETLVRVSVRAGVWTALPSRLAGTAITAIQLGALAVGAWLVTEHDLTLGLLVTFLGLLGNVAGAGQALLDAIPLATRGAGNLARVQEMLAAPIAVVEAPDAVPAGPLMDAIAFDRVSFGYDPDGPPNLHDVSFAIQAGERVAIVGPSGSGKSTALSLLMRLDDPQAGVVSYDGQDLRAVTEASLRAQTGVVLQQPCLFETSVRENIRMGQIDADDAAVERAGRQADAHDFILDLPGGYDTAIGRRGGGLSGGQRQRIAIARALLGDPRLLVLDEATSALDPATEHAIGQTLAQLEGERTVVSVTHRLRTVVDYERILVLVKGRLVEQGRHEELLAHNGHYAALWEKQAGITVAPAGDDASVTPARLRRIRFLADLSMAHLEELAEALVPERFRAGENVFVEGDPGDRLYLIARGSLEAVIQDGDQERILTVMDDGDVFGEIAIVRDMPRTATVRARVPSLCMSLARGSFRRLLADVPELRGNVEATISERLARSAAVRESERAPASGL